jgi:hypothetical protein
MTNSQTKAVDEQLDEILASVFLDAFMSGRENKTHAELPTDEKSKLQLAKQSLLALIKEEKIKALKDADVIVLSDETMNRVVRILDIPKED